MYNATKWLDKVVDVDSGEVIQAGTDQSAAHFNNMESGITDASVAAAMLLIAAGELQLVGVEVVHGTRIAAATQEDGEHAVVAAQLRPGEHPAVGLGKVIDIP